MKKIIIIPFILLTLMLLCFNLLDFYPVYHGKFNFNYLKGNYNVPGVEHVYIVLIDGLRYDAVLKNMPYMTGYIESQKACMMKCMVDGPSNSRPGYARIFTGTRNKINGVWFNWQSSRCRVPSIFETAVHSGLSTGVSGFYWLGQLFNKSYVTNSLHCDTSDNIQYTYFYLRDTEEDEKVFRMGNQIIMRYNPSLFLIHPMGVDKAGHKYGGSSVYYGNSVQKIDTLINKLIKNIDLNKSVLIVTSDHGHKDHGGHGGKSIKEVEVPVIFMGNIVNGGICGEVVSQEDIAPTILNLLRVPPAPYMEGKIIELPF